MTSPTNRLVTFLFLTVSILSILALPIANGAPTTYSIDWAMSNPSVSPSSPKGGDLMTFNVVVTQVSSNWPGSLIVIVTMGLDGKTFDTVTVVNNQPGPVPAGFTNTVTTKPWIAKEGTHQVDWALIFAGGDSTVLLVDPNPNNKASLQLSVAPGPLAVQSLPVGSWWTTTGTYYLDKAGTGVDSGKYREDDTYTQKLTVVSSNDKTIVITNSYTTSWTCTATDAQIDNCGGQTNKGTYSSQTDYTIDIVTLEVTATSSDGAKEYVGHPTWVLLAAKFGVGDKALIYWYTPKSDATDDTITDVLGKVDRIQRINVKGVDVNARVLTYSGQHLGTFYRVGTKVYSKGMRTDSELYDTVYGIDMGWTIDGSYSYSDSKGSWTETTHDTAQITDTNIQFKPPQVSITLGAKPARAAVTVDNVSYTSNQLPKVFTWDPGSTHTLKVDATIEGSPGLRYVFVQWSDGSKDASRSITATQSGNLTATYKTQYELKVISDLGDPEGSGWYDAGNTARFSVTSPQPATGLFGSLGGKATFQTWTGDSTESTATADIVLDSPKTVQAEWTTDNSVPYMILGGVGVAIAVVIILALLLMRHKKTPTPSYSPAPPPPPARAQPPFCKNCGNPTTYIEQYQRYYCYNCQKYE